MICYHRTPFPQAILDNGFEDRRGTYLTTETLEGVWVSDVPLDCNEGAEGLTVLSVEVPEELLIPHEWVEKGKPYREFLVPAATLNTYGPPVIYDDDWKGCSRKQMLHMISVMEEKGLEKKARTTRDHLPFLDRHGLLEE